MEEGIASIEKRKAAQSPMATPPPRRRVRGKSPASRTAHAALAASSSEESCQALAALPLPPFDSAPGSLPPSAREALDEALVPWTAASPCGLVTSALRLGHRRAPLEQPGTTSFKRLSALQDLLAERVTAKRYELQRRVQANEEIEAIELRTAAGLEKRAADAQAEQEAGEWRREASQAEVREALENHQLQSASEELAFQEKLANTEESIAVLLAKAQAEEIWERQEAIMYAEERLVRRDEAEIGRMCFAEEELCYKARRRTNEADHSADEENESNAEKVQEAEEHRASVECSMREEVKSMGVDGYSCVTSILACRGALERDVAETYEAIEGEVELVSVEAEEEATEAELAENEFWEASECATDSQVRTKMERTEFSEQYVAAHRQAQLAAEQSQEESECKEEALHRQEEAARVEATDMCKRELAAIAKEVDELANLDHVIQDEQAAAEAAEARASGSARSADERARARRESAGREEANARAVRAILLEHTQATSIASSQRIEAAIQAVRTKQEANNERMRKAAVEKECLQEAHLRTEESTAAWALERERVEAAAGHHEAEVRCHALQAINSRNAKMDVAMKAAGERLAAEEEEAAEKLARKQHSEQEMEAAALQAEEVAAQRRLRAEHLAEALRIGHRAKEESAEEEAKELLASEAKAEARAAAAERNSLQAAAAQQEEAAEVQSAGQERSAEREKVEASELESVLGLAGAAEDRLAAVGRSEQEMREEVRAVAGVEANAARQRLIYVSTEAEEGALHREGEHDIQLLRTEAFDKKHAAGMEAKAQSERQVMAADSIAEEQYTKREEELAEMASAIGRREVRVAAREEAVAEALCLVQSEQEQELLEAASMGTRAEEARLACSLRAESAVRCSAEKEEASNNFIEELTEKSQKVRARWRHQEQVRKRLKLIGHIASQPFPVAHEWHADSPRSFARSFTAPQEELSETEWERSQEDGLLQSPGARSGAVSGESPRSPSP